MKLKKIAVVLAFVMVFTACGNAFAEYRTGSAAGDGAVYGTVGAVAGGGAMAAVLSWFGGTLTVLCPPVGIAAVVSGVYLGWYGATEEDKSFKKDVENTASAVTWGLTAGSGYAAAKAAKEGGEAILQMAY